MEQGGQQQQQEVEHGLVVQVELRTRRPASSYMEKVCVGPPQWPETGSTPGIFSHSSLQPSAGHLSTFLISKNKIKVFSACTLCMPACAQPSLLSAHNKLRRSQLYNWNSFLCGTGGGSPGLRLPGKRLVSGVVTVRETRQQAGPAWQCSGAAALRCLPPPPSPAVKPSYLTHQY